jgi:hypothetical protein
MSSGAGCLLSWCFSHGWHDECTATPRINQIYVETHEAFPQCNSYSNSLDNNKESELEIAFSNSILLQLSFPFIHIYSVIVHIPFTCTRVIPFTCTRVIHLSFTRAVTLSVTRVLRLSAIALQPN